VTPDNSTLIFAESYGKGLTAFDIAADGSLSSWRVWADRVGACPTVFYLDAENAIWYGDLPVECRVCVREGGEVLQTIDLDRSCFACMLRDEGRTPSSARHANGEDRARAVRRWTGHEGSPAPPCI